MFNEYMVKYSWSRAFTLIEIMVVIVSIGVLAALTYVGYSTVKKNAIISNLNSDLNNAADLLEIFQFQNKEYPTTIDCNIPDSETNLCIHLSADTTYKYVPQNLLTPQKYSLYLTNSAMTYRIFSMAGSDIPTPVASVSCPSGYIPVFGSSTYSTKDFCVMKYEAKNVGGVATSQATGTPWVNITQTGSGSATEKAAASCSGCHLITEAEWMTIAQNVLSVPSNWSSGVVGSGYIYSGHNDNAPANALEATTNDNDGFYNTGNTSGNQRRTLTLTNGEVIWDFAGNVWEWTAEQKSGGQPSPAGDAFREWTAVSGGSFLVNPYPSGTLLTGASSWNSSNGIGKIRSDSNDSALRGFLRGGSYNNTSEAGVLMLALSAAPSYSSISLGFRAAL